MIEDEPAEAIAEAAPLQIDEDHSQLRPVLLNVLESAQNDRSAIRADVYERDVGKDGDHYGDVILPIDTASVRTIHSDVIRKDRRDAEEREIKCSWVRRIVCVVVALPPIRLVVVVIGSWLLCEPEQ